MLSLSPLSVIFRLFCLRLLLVDISLNPQLLEKLGTHRRQPWGEIEPEVGSRSSAEYCPEGLDLLDRMLCYDHQARMGRGGACTLSMYSHSHLTINPRIPTLPGRSTSNFHRPGGCCMFQARSAVKFGMVGREGAVANVND